MIEIMNYARKFHSNATGLHDVDGDDEHDYDDEFDGKNFMLMLQVVTMIRNFII